MSLEGYRKKRDFKKALEPAGEPAKARKSNQPLYVIQKHQATRLHYDLRLEMDGVLKSWAIPKEPPTQPGEKRLAVQTEDHPIEYGNFEGIIEEGQYGAGNVEIWDRGDFEILKREENEIIAKINGEKLNGIYCLIRFKPQEDPKNWLFFKRKS